MDLKQQTIDTYNLSADALAEKFNNQGARVEDIDLAFSYISKENPFALEIGCGNARDAEEILKHTDRYLGVDISEKLINLAHKRLPKATFEVADIETYQFPHGIDIVFAFASLIHVQKENMRKILQDVHDALNEGGVVFLSFKHSDAYIQVTKDDEFGTRTYWYYSEQDIREIAPQFTFEHVNIHDMRGQVWMELLLRKK